MGEADTAWAPSGRREQKKLQTRRAIKDAALNLALEQGVESVTIEAISQAAGVAPRTFFNYFACKEDALVTDAMEVATELHQMVIDRPDSESPLRAVRAVLAKSRFFDVGDGDRERMLARHRLVNEHFALMSRQLAEYARVERAFADALAQRLGVDPEQDLRPALLASVTVGVLRVAMRRWAADGQRLPHEQIDTAFELLERGEFSEPVPHSTVADGAVR